MTDYIKEMMKAAGVRVKKICGSSDSLCNNFRLKKELYPTFTPEKQLEIIKLIGRERGFEITPNEGYDYMLSETTYAEYKYNKQGYSMTDFTQALAQLVVELMNAGGLDKEKVKDILESETLRNLS